MAAGAGAIRAGEAYVELMLKNRIPLGLKKAAAQLRAFGATVSAMGTRLIAWGAAVAAPLIATTKIFASMGDDAIKMSKRTGFSVEALSALDYAAKLSGSSIEDVEKAVKRMQMSMIDAARGSKEVTDTFKMLGLNVDQLRAMDPEQQFLTIAEALSRVPDASARAGLALKLFGRSGTALLPMMEQGARGVEALMAEAKRFGLVITTDEAKAAAKFRDDMTKIWAVVKKAAFNIGSALAPAISEVAGRIRDWVANVSDWLKQNKELIVSVMKGALAVVGLGIGMVILGKTISGLGGILMVLSVAMKAVGIAFVILKAAVLLPLSPINLLIAAFGALVVAGILWSDRGKAAVETVRKAWSTLADDVLLAKQGIVDALMAGDIGLAAKILWLTIKLEGELALLALKKAWWAFKGWLLETWHGMVAAWLIVCNTIADLWIRLDAANTKTIVKAMSLWERASSALGDSLLKTFIKLKAARGQITEDEKNQQLKLVDEIAKQREKKEKTLTAAVLKHLEEQKTTALKMLNTQFEKDMAAVGDKLKALDEELDARTKAGEIEIANARKALALTVQEAALKRMAVSAEKESRELFAEYNWPKKGIDLGSVMAEVESKREVRGMFSPARLAGLAAASPIQERIAAAAEKTADNTDEMNDKMDELGPVYE